eukprot:TRINITY_DN6278_c0_g1_i1.p1 TRINITY_DN6278_c0_g1~~TRINITY_DN6278_c0_g1_i1.p1  ORF type:complete len:427 (+),score=121.04 TRINITY_DN6278_c0_g1_i1:185-1465(+)
MRQPECSQTENGALDASSSQHVAGLDSVEPLKVQTGLTLAALASLQEVPQVGAKDNGRLAEENAKLARENAELLERVALVQENMSLQKENARLQEENRRLRMREQITYEKYSKGLVGGGGMPAWAAPAPGLSIGPNFGSPRDDAGGYPWDTVNEQVVAGPLGMDSCSDLPFVPLRSSGMAAEMAAAACKRGISSRSANLPAASSTGSAGGAPGTVSKEFALMGLKKTSAPSVVSQGSRSTTSYADSALSFNTNGLESSEASFASEDDPKLREEALRTSTAPTTVMMRNIPNNYSRDLLLSLVDELGFEGTYDMVYLPVDFKTEVGLGYAFLNFAEHEAAAKFRDRFKGFRDWKVLSEKVCEVSWSDALQGLHHHIQRYRNSPVMHETVPDVFKPALFENGQRVAFPPPTKKIRAPRPWSRRQSTIP